MNYSPVKGKLGDFFRTITKKATPETKAKRAEAKTTRNAGESQYKADVRTKRATSRANKKVDKGELTKNIVDTSQKGDEAVRPKKATVANKPESKGEPKGELTRKQQYDKKGWKYDDTIKGYNRDGTKKTEKKEKVNKKFNTKTFSKTQFEKAKK